MIPALKEVGDIVRLVAAAAVFAAAFAVGVGFTVWVAVWTHYFSVQYLPWPY